MKNKVASLLIFSILLALFGCQENVPEEEPKGDELSLTEENPLNVDVASLLARETYINEHSPKSSNALAFDLYKDLSANEKNLTFSPFSVSLALAMTYAGARNETEDAMKKVLYYGDNNLDFHKSYGELANLMSHKDRSNTDTTLTISNGLWLEKDYAVFDDFKNTLADGYSAKPTSLDFQNQPGPSTKLINEAVATDTNGEIKNLLKTDLTDETRFVLTNAMYFKSKWQTAFDNDKSSVETFNLSDGNSRDATFMKQEDKVLYGEDSEKQFVLLPYKDSDFATLFVLPREGKLKSVELSLNDQSFDYMMNAMDMKDVSLWLPKFEHRTSPNLKEVLTKRGLGILFDKDRADLKKINDNSLAEGNLYVGDVVHEAVVKMYEEGTTAAAASAVIGVVATSIPNPPENLVNFHADRPFLFHIVHKPSNTILFMGRVDEPMKENM